MREACSTAAVYFCMPVVNSWLTPELLASCPDRLHHGICPSFPSVPALVAVGCGLVMLCAVCVLHAVCIAQAVLHILERLPMLACAVHAVLCVLYVGT